MNKREECLKRLIRKANLYSEITDWMLEQKLIDKDSLKTISREQERVDLILSTLDTKEESGEILLADFTWTVLPIEQIQLLITTSREERSFTYGL